MVSPEETSPGTSPVIRRPDNAGLLEKLRRKREEYKQRIAEYGPYKHPEQLLVEALASGSSGPLGSMLKLRLLDEVLECESGEVRTWEFTKRAAEDSIFESTITCDSTLFYEKLANACGVIEAYCTGNEDIVLGGTGLH